jgi:VCBS repeat-containing protein
MVMGAKIDLFQLEQRQLFDGAAFASVVSTDASVDDRENNAFRSDAAAVDREALEASFGLERATNTPASNGKLGHRELLVIDASVQDWTSLTSNLGPEVDVLLLDADKDGLQQIADQLLTHNTNSDGQQGRYSSLHLLSHGREGVIQLGNRTINAQTVAQAHSEFAQIGDNLEIGADVLLYGCDVGSNARGINFLRTLSEATQRDVAASTNKTGGTVAGGDWVLEAQVGDIANSSAVGSALIEDVGYQYLLAENRAPVAVDDSRIISANQGFTNGQAIKGNTFGDLPDSDPDGDGFTVAGIQAGNVAGPVLTGVSSPIQGQWGAIQIDEFGGYSYTPNAAALSLTIGQFKSDVFTYTICDSNGALDSATITISLYGAKPANQPPVAVADVRTLCESEIINNGQAVLGNLLGDQADYDPEGQSFNLIGITLGDVSSGPAVSGGLGTPIVGQFGTLVLSLDGSYTYTPNANAIALFAGQFGKDVFTYSICDSDGITANTTISITVCGEGSPKPVNRPPIATNDVREICEDDILNNGQAVRGNSLGDVKDSDPDGDSLKVAGVGARDSSGNLSANVGSPVIGQWGSIVVASDGSYIYTPNAAAQGLKAGQNVSDIFRYTVCDTAGLLSTATITINICGVNDAPVARNDARTVCEDDVLLDGKAIVGNLAGDIADSDPDGDPLKVQGIVAGAAIGNVSGGIGAAIAGEWGTIAIDRDGNYVYRPNAAAQTLSEGETVKDVFTYTICDPSGALSTAKITIDVCGQNDAPIARDDIRTTTPSTPITNGGAITGNALGDTKDGDSDRRDVLTVVGVRPGIEDPNCLPAATGGIRASAAEQANVNKPIEGTYGSLTLKPDGSYSYQPNAVAQALLEGQKVQDVFAYIVSDGKGGSDCAQITIRMEGTVKPVKEPPVVPPVVVPPVVVPPVVVAPPVIEAPPLVVLPTGRTNTSSTFASVVPTIAVPIILSRPQLALGSALIPEQVGALLASPFGETPRVVKGFVEEAAPAKEDCVPVQKAVAKPGEKIVAKVKPKVKPSIFQGAIDKPNRSFSEQVKTAAKRFKVPAKVAPRIVEKEC